MRDAPVASSSRPKRPERELRRSSGRSSLTSRVRVASSEAGWISATRPSRSWSRPSRRTGTDAADRELVHGRLGHPRLEAERAGSLQDQERLSGHGGVSDVGELGGDHPGEGSPEDRRSGERARLGLSRLGDAPLRDGRVVLGDGDHLPAPSGSTARSRSRLASADTARVCSRRASISRAESLTRTSPGPDRAAQPDPDLGHRAADQRGDGGAADGADGPDHLGHHRTARSLGLYDLDDLGRHARRRPLCVFPHSPRARRAARGTHGGSVVRWSGPTGCGAKPRRPLRRTWLGRGCSVARCAWRRFRSRGHAGASAPENRVLSWGWSGVPARDFSRLTRTRAGPPRGHRALAYRGVHPRSPLRGQRNVGSGLPGRPPSRSRDGRPAR